MLIPVYLVVLSFYMINIALPPTIAYGEEIDLTRSFIEFFTGICLRPLPDIERIKAGARLLDWQPLEGDLAAVIAPADPRAKWQGWATLHEDNVYMIGVSEGYNENKKIVTCTVAVRGIDQVKLVEDLEKLLVLTLIDDDIEALQRYRFWKTRIDGEVRNLNLTTMADSRISTASLTALATID